MPYHWSTHQLTEYLVNVSRPQDPAAAMAVALEHAVEALDAEVAAVVTHGQVVASVGFGARGVPEAFLNASTGDAEAVELERAGLIHLARGELDKAASRRGGTGGRLVVGRIGEGYAAEEVQMLQGMALVLGLRLQNLDTLQAERSRHRLVETLLSIQRAVSARRPLKEVLDAVTRGASSLLGGCPVALLLTDPLTPGALVPASTFDLHELDEDTLAVIGRAVTRAAADVHSPAAETHGSSGGVKVIAEPVAVDGEVVGCLGARVDPRHPRGREHGDLLAAFAQQVSLALTDARAVDAVREANRDSITGLPNRALFLQCVEQASRGALGHGHDLAVLFIDLDRFKSVNDTLGHQAGDDVLAEVATRIRGCLRPGDVAARLGGDEFAVLLDDADVELARAIADRVITALGSTFCIAGREVFVGASVGIAPLRASQQGAGALLGDADVAMYCAKRSGRGQAVVFEPSMHDEVAMRLTLRTDLQRAYHTGQLWLAYQPIVRIGTGRLTGAEALMRWTHPERGPIPPSEFIPVAEETSMIIPMGSWVLHQGLADVVAWRERTPGLGVNVNVSARQIVDPDLPAVVRSALEASGLPARALTLEITESILMDDPDLARRRLVALKDLGLQLAIDDFGTGYSSLAYLRDFPVDQVKIDRSFIKGLRADSPDDIAVVRSVLSLCQSLRLCTVAEGIERRDQLAILSDLGCDLGQGYLFGRPVAPRQWPTAGALPEEAAGWEGRPLDERFLPAPSRTG